VEIMPLPKKATKRQQSKARLLRWQARQAAIKYWGDDMVRGMTVHHKNGDTTDNRRKNLDLIPKDKHGRIHGRGVSSALPFKNKIKIKLKKIKKYI
jgi:hypothetical protein